ncbi:hypothetical protein [Aureliella helgolandensis]|uniref:Uncharacterized protein n=1 Tax=Aureliella helgolandensis TaxID=2527968 RepID=A0A518GH38_9BACT|nr:hypothetical protein [Aureliella helgolandensis]QDV27878.1 hypothetical protein Q31a_62710 [Aureliella helgolandensis]
MPFAPPQKILQLVCLAVLCCLAGCGEDIEIRTYQVAKSDTNRKPVSAKSPASMTEKQMLAAIVPHGSTAWFFKLTGDVAKVEEQREAFHRTVTSVGFGESGIPTWQLEEGWTEKIERGITYARIIAPSGDVEATVTQLPVSPDALEDAGWKDYVVINVNRWRGQLSLASQGWDAMSSELEELPELSEGAAKAYWVSLIGRGSGGMGGGPFMNRMGATPPAAAEVASPHSTSANEEATAAEPTRSQADMAEDEAPSPTAESVGEAPAEKPPVAKSSSDLQYDVPEGWSEIAASGMRRAAFTIEQDSSTAEVTVIAAGGSIDANIGIWMGQVSVETTEELKREILESAEQVQVHEIDASYYTIDGSETEEKQSILVADIPWKSGESLFVKLKGDAELVRNQQDAFVKFLESLQW